MRVVPEDFKELGSDDDNSCNVMMNPFIHPSA
jgi:hypothetical protein